LPAVAHWQSAHDVVNRFEHEGGAAVVKEETLSLGAMVFGAPYSTAAQMYFRGQIDLPGVDSALGTITGFVFIV